MAPVYEGVYEGVCEGITSAATPSTLPNPCSAATASERRRRQRATERSAAPAAVPSLCNSGYGSAMAEPNAPKAADEDGLLRRGRRAKGAKGANPRSQGRRLEDPRRQHSRRGHPRARGSGVAVSVGQRPRPSCSTRSMSCHQRRSRAIVRGIATLAISGLMAIPATVGCRGTTSITERPWRCARALVHLQVADRRSLGSLAAPGAGGGAFPAHFAATRRNRAAVRKRGL